MPGKVKMYTRRQRHKARLAREKEEAEARKDAARLQKILDRPDPKVEAALKGCEDW